MFVLSCCMIDVCIVCWWIFESGLLLCFEVIGNGVHSSIARVFRREAGVCVCTYFNPRGVCRIVNKHMIPVVIKCTSKYLTSYRVPGII